MRKEKTASYAKKEGGKLSASQQRVMAVRGKKMGE